MGRRSQVIITCDDTGKEYVFDGVNKNPQVLMINIRYAFVDMDGYARIDSYTQAKEFYVTRQFADKLLFQKKDMPVEEKRDKVRECLEKLMSLIGIYPQE